MKKASAPLSATRRDVLGGMAALLNPVKGMPGAASVVDQAAAAWVTESPRLALIHMMGLLEQLRNIHWYLPREFCDAATYGNPRAEREFVENIDAHKTEVNYFLEHPHPMQEELECLMHYASWGRQELQRMGELTDWSPSNDEAGVQQLLRLKIFQNSDRFETLSHKPELLERHIISALETYREHYTMLSQFEAAMQQQPKLFARALSELAQGLPELFAQEPAISPMPDTSTHGFPNLWAEQNPPSMEHWLRQLQQTMRRPLAMIEPEKLEAHVWQQFGQSTGIVPKAATNEVQHAVRKIIEQPQYEPFLSPRAARARAMQASAQWLQKLPVHIRHGEKEVALHLPDSSGQYKEIAGNHAVPAVDICIPPTGDHTTDCSGEMALLDLKQRLHETYPVTPQEGVISSALRYHVPHRVQHHYADRRLTIMTRRLHCAVGWKNWNRKNYQWKYPRPWQHEPSRCRIRLL